MDPDWYHYGTELMLGVETRQDSDRWELHCNWLYVHVTALINRCVHSRLKCLQPTHLPRLYTMAESGQYQSLQAPPPTLYQPQPLSTLYPPTYDPPAGRPSFYENEDRRISRTPSPTPSEVEALADKGGINWKKLFQFNRKNISTFDDAFYIRTKLIVVL